MTTTFSRECMTSRGVGGGGEIMLRSSSRVDSLVGAGMLASTTYSQCPQALRLLARRVEDPVSKSSCCANASHKTYPTQNYGGRSFGIILH